MQPIIALLLDRIKVSLLMKKNLPIQVLVNPQAVTPVLPTVRVQRKALKNPLPLPAKTQNNQSFSGMNLMNPAKPGFIIHKNLVSSIPGKQKR
jgi:hypothetical protein